jgi:hypothetical protein
MNFQAQKSQNSTVNTLVNSIAVVKEVNQFYSVNEIRLMDYREGKHKG